MFLRLSTFTFILFYFILLPLGYSQNISLGKPEGFKLEKLEGKKVIISFTLKIENVSSKGVGVTVKKGQLYKDGELMGTFKLLDKIKLKKNSYEGVPIRVQVDLEKELDLLQNIQAFLMKPIEMRLTGKVKATWIVFWKKYPFDYSEKISGKNFF